MWLKNFTEKFKKESLPILQDESVINDISFGHSYRFQNLLLPVARCTFLSADDDRLHKLVAKAGLCIIGTNIVKPVVGSELEMPMLTLSYQQAIDDALEEQVKKYYVSWDSVKAFVKELADKIEREDLRFTGIYEIPRGGLCIAAMLSHRLDLPLLLAPYKNCIIVDDIADSGKTLIHYTKNDTQFNDYYIATMYYAERSVVTPDFYTHKKTDKWIVFPWEEI